MLYVRNVPCGSVYRQWTCSTRRHDNKHLSENDPEIGSDLFVGTLFDLCQYEYIRWPKERSKKDGEPHTLVVELDHNENLKTERASILSLVCLLIGAFGVMVLGAPFFLRCGYRIRNCEPISSWVSLKQ